MAKGPPLKCKDCERWYGAEDDEIGPCTIKNMRGDKRYMTLGMHDCDEGLRSRPGRTSTAELYELRFGRKATDCLDSRPKGGG